MNVSVQLQRAVRLHQAGSLTEAAEIYQQVLEHDPSVADAWHLIGLIAQQVGELPRAVDHLLRAIELDANQPVFQANLASVCLTIGDLDAAESACLACQRRFPAHAEGWMLHGNVERCRGNLTAAVSLYRRAIVCQPKFAAAMSNLGGVLIALGELHQAEQCLKQAYDWQPDLTETLSNLGVLARHQGNLTVAIEWFQRALQLDPAKAEVRMNLANCLRQQGQLGAAIQAYEQTLAVNPELAGVYSGIAMVFQDLGRPEEARPFFQRARAIAPQTQNHHSNYLFCLNLCSDVSRVDLFAEHLAWGRSVPRPASISKSGVTIDPHRPLHIGYLSPDLRRHAVAQFIEPILSSHRRSGHQVYCYAEVAAPDSTTDRLRSLVHGWHFTCGRTDAELADQIRADGIDVLVDLAGHTANNRLTVMTHQAAPVQVSMLGYPYSTGLSEVDYYVTNPWRDPEGEERFYSEQLVRLKNGPTTFRGPAAASPVLDPPVLRNGTITFGSTHRLDKLTDATLSLWQQVLAGIPTSRLLVFRTSLRDNLDARSELLERMSRCGIDLDRIDLRCETEGSYLNIYHEIDLLLEVTPWGSGTTAYEALWMGVPVVGLYGERPTSRPVCALLERMGLPELVAHNVDQYVTIQGELAGDLGRLSQLRHRFRDLMRQTVGDADAFTTELEQAYRQMWQTWCQRQIVDNSAVPPAGLVSTANANLWCEPQNGSHTNR